jgi:hypothetical protein
MRFLVHWVELHQYGIVIDCDSTLPFIIAVPFTVITSTTHYYYSDYIIVRH